MAMLCVDKVVERLDEYDLEIIIRYQYDTHRIGVSIPKPISKAKVQDAIKEVLKNRPPTGDAKLSCYWEGFEMELSSAQEERTLVQRLIPRWQRFKKRAERIIFLLPDDVV